MSQESYSVLLRNLSNDYFHGRINFDEYRIQRKIILDKIDEDFNGIESGVNEDDQQDEASILMQTVKFFKGKDL